MPVSCDGQIRVFQFEKQTPQSLSACAACCKQPITSYRPHPSRRWVSAQAPGQCPGDQKYKPHACKKGKIQVSHTPRGIDRPMRASQECIQKSLPPVVNAQPISDSQAQRASVRSSHRPFNKHPLPPPSLPPFPLYRNPALPLCLTPSISRMLLLLPRIVGLVVSIRGRRRWRRHRDGRPPHLGWRRT